MLLLENGRPVPDPYVTLADDAALPDTGGVIVSLERWRTEDEALATGGRPVGVRLKSHQLADSVAGDLDRLSLVAVELPKFRDGRAFSTARELRERYVYTGEIRAVGHIIPDQYLFLLRAGVSTVEVPEDRYTDAWANALAEYTVAYQPAIRGDAPLSALRRRLTLGAAR